MRLKFGDKITFASVYAVNRLTKQATDHLKCFTVTEDCSSDAGGLMAVKISPAIELAGPYQNVSALPANGDAVKTFGAVSTYQNVVTNMGIIGNKGAYALATADLEKMDRDIKSDSSPCRVDMMFGYSAPRENLAIVVVG